MWVFHHGNLRGPPQSYSPKKYCPNRAILRETNGFSSQKIRPAIYWGGGYLRFPWFHHASCGLSPGVFWWIPGKVIACFFFFTLVDPRYLLRFLNGVWMVCFRVQIPKQTSGGVNGCFLGHVVVKQRVFFWGDCISEEWKRTSQSCIPFYCFIASGSGSLHLGSHIQKTFVYNI